MGQAHEGREKLGMNRKNQPSGGINNNYKQNLPNGRVFKCGQNPYV